MIFARILIFDVQVFGGSWGSTLSLFYAQRYPERVRLSNGRHNTSTVLEIQGLTAPVICCLAPGQWTYSPWNISGPEEGN